MRRKVLGAWLVAGCAQDFAVYQEPPRLVAEPPLLDFGTRWVEEAASADVEITLAAGRLARLERVELLTHEGDAIAIGETGGRVLERDAVLLLPVSFLARTSGPHAARVTITTDDPLRDPLVVEIRGVGAHPEIAPLPAVTDFGPVEPGSAGVAHVRWANRTDRDARVTGWVTSSTAFRVVTTGDVVIPARGEVEIEVAYDAVDALPASGTLALIVDGRSPRATAGLRANDCDGGTPGLYDQDGDGVTACAGDCDDDDDGVHPGATELPDGVDQDCDGVVDEGTSARDDDGDGYCEGPVCTDGAAPGDCDDADPTVAPGRPELPNGRDDDCDGVVDEGTTAYDDDGDGFTEDGGDCDDADPLVNPARGNCP